MKTSLGIDVSKNSFNVAIYEKESENEFKMNPKDIKKSIEWIKKQNPKLVVLEPTGGYERRLLEDLVDADIPVSLVNARHIRDFARASGRLAKTDKIDAQVISHYAHVMNPRKFESMTDQQKELKALVSRRRQLVHLRSVEQNHKENIHYSTINKNINETISCLTHQIDEIEKLITKLIKSDSQMNEKINQLMSVPGIGEKTAAMLIADLPELGRLNRKQIASIVGVAPINRDSGKWRGKRMTGSGRKNVRTGLFMSMLSIIQFNDKLKPFYDRLVKSGKAKMVALIATMRKLLVILNSMIKNSQYWKTCS